MKIAVTSERGTTGWQRKNRRKMILMSSEHRNENQLKQNCDMPKCWKRFPWRFFLNFPWQLGGRGNGVRGWVTKGHFISRRFSNSRTFKWIFEFSLTFPSATSTRSHRERSQPFPELFPLIYVYKYDKRKQSFKGTNDNYENCGSFFRSTSRLLFESILSENILIIKF